MWLIVNAGSSSLKLKLFDGEREVAKAFVGEIGPDGHKAAMSEGLAQAGIRTPGCSTGCPTSSSSGG